VRPAPGAAAIESETVKAGAATEAEGDFGGKTD